MSLNSIKKHWLRPNRQYICDMIVFGNDTLKLIDIIHDDDSNLGASLTKDYLLVCRAKKKGGAPHWCNFPLEQTAMPEETSK